jgi:solute carrier family 25 carnitine/acylcarnitine transporter 20/29
MSSPLVGVAMVNAMLFGVYGAILESMLTDPKQQSPTYTQIFIAGSGSGFINAFVSCPMELVKIKLQNQTTASPSRRSPASLNRAFSTATPSHPKTFKGPIDCFMHIYRTNGIRGLFTGLPSTVLRETPSYGAYFVAYEVLCRMLAPPGTDPKEISGVRLMLAGTAYAFGFICRWSWWDYRMGQHGTLCYPSC